MVLEGICRNARRRPVDVVFELDVNRGLFQAGIVVGYGMGRVVPKDDIVFEVERNVFLDARMLDHVRFGEREYVVAERVVLAVMLVDGSRLDTVDDVRLEEEVRRAFVRVKAPAAATRVVVAPDVVDFVSDDEGVLVVAERVDAAHVVENAVSDMVDAVVEDFDVAVGGFLVAPRPAGRYARVAVVADIVVGNGDVRGVADPNADACREEVSAVADDVVVDKSVVRELRFFRLRRPYRLADVKAARAAVFNQVADEFEVAASVFDPDHVAAGMRHAAGFECEIFRPRAEDRRRRDRCRLSVFDAVGDVVGRV